MIPTLLTTACLWFHTLATIVLIGHYLLLALVYLPVFKQRFNSKSLFDLLSVLNGTIRPRIYAALGVFAITGIYLMLVNDSYQGVGNFSNAWSVLMLVKHLLIGVMIVLMMMFNHAVQAGAARSEGDTNGSSRLDLILRAISFSGLLVILLTTFAQA